jgi:hypothetical protein
MEKRFILDYDKDLGILYVAILGDSELNEEQTKEFDECLREYVPLKYTGMEGKLHVLQLTVPKIRSFQPTKIRFMEHIQLGVRSFRK